jgi:hypothetical protein
MAGPDDSVDLEQWFPKPILLCRQTDHNPELRWLTETSLYRSATHDDCLILEQTTTLLPSDQPQLGVRLEIQPPPKSRILLSIQQLVGLLPHLQAAANGM